MIIHNNLFKILIPTINDASYHHVCEKNFFYQKVTSTPHICILECLPTQTLSIWTYFSCNRWVCTVQLHDGWVPDSRIGHQFYLHHIHTLFSNLKYLYHGRVYSIWKTKTYKLRYINKKRACTQYTWLVSLQFFY